MPQLRSMMVESAPRCFIEFQIICRVEPIAQCSQRKALRGFVCEITTKGLHEVFQDSLARLLRSRVFGKGMCFGRLHGSIQRLRRIRNRYLLSPPNGDGSKTAPHYDKLSLESARRKAFFEWTPEHLEEIASNADALGLALWK
jgi:hypothetical protein